MTTTATPVQELRPLDHERWMRLAETEYGRLLALLDSLDAGDWSRPTDCTAWDVRSIVGHLVGMMKNNADAQEAQRQRTIATEIAEKNGGLRLDAMTDLQVREHAHLSPAEITRAAHEAVPGALAGRRGLTPEMHATSYSPGLPREGMWTYGYTLDVVITRDTWIHRVDITRATGREMVLTADHDALIVQDVVREWARRHAQPFALLLDGPAGGSFCSGDGGPALHLDAVEFCRILSGRSRGDGLLATPVPF